MSSVQQQQQTLITQVRQLFLTLVDQAANDAATDGDTTQQAADVATIRSVLERMSIACAREAAAREKVDQLDDNEEGKSSSRPGGLLEEDVAQQAMRFSTLLSIGDQCEAAILELFQVAAMWQGIDDDLLECGAIQTSTIQYECLRQRRHVTRLALDIMDQQLVAERERLRLDGVATTGGKIPTRLQKERRGKQKSLPQGKETQI